MKPVLWPKPGAYRRHISDISQRRYRDASVSQQSGQFVHRHYNCGIVISHASRLCCFIWEKFLEAEAYQTVSQIDDVSISTVVSCHSFDWTIEGEKSRYRRNNHSLFYVQSAKCEILSHVMQTRKVQICRAYIHFLLYNFHLTVTGEYNKYRYWL